MVDFGKAKARFVRLTYTERTKYWLRWSISGSLQYFRGIDIQQYWQFAIYCPIYLGSGQILRLWDSPAFSRSVEVSIRY